MRLPIRVRKLSQTRPGSADDLGRYADIWDFHNGGRWCRGFIVGRHGAEKAPPNDGLMTAVVGALLVLLAGVCLLAVF